MDSDFPLAIHSILWLMVGSANLDEMETKSTNTTYKDRQWYCKLVMDEHAIDKSIHTLHQ